MIIMIVTATMRGHSGKQAAWYLVNGISHKKNIVFRKQAACQLNLLSEKNLSLKHETRKH